MRVSIIDRYSEKWHLIFTICKLVGLVIVMGMWLDSARLLPEIYNAGIELDVRELTLGMCVLYAIFGSVVVIAMVAVVFGKSSSYKLHRSWSDIDHLLWKGKAQDTYAIGSTDNLVTFRAYLATSDGVESMTILINTDRVRILLPVPSIAQE